jgi:hypothetical protein
MNKACKCPFSTELRCCCFFKSGQWNIVSFEFVFRPGFILRMSQFCVSTTLTLASFSLVDSCVIYRVCRQIAELVRLHFLNLKFCDIPECPKIPTTCYQYNDWSIDINNILSHRNGPRKNVRNEIWRKGKSVMTCWNHQRRDYHHEPCLVFATATRCLGYSSNPLLFCIVFLPRRRRERDLHLSSNFRCKT